MGVQNADICSKNLKIYDKLIVVIKNLNFLAVFVTKNKKNKTSTYAFCWEIVYAISFA